MEQLPHNIRLKLEQTLSQWRQWRCTSMLQGPPETIRTLGPGTSNFSILVGAAQRFVVRLDGINPAAHGLNRHCEWRVLQSAYRAGLAPRPCYFNPELGSLVCEYLEPSTPAPTSSAETAALIRAIHRLPHTHHRLNLADRIQRYEKLLQHKGTGEALLAVRQQVWNKLEEASTGQEETALCHHDLLQANRIYSDNQLWAIDWEYAAMGDPWYDLAVIIQGDGMDDTAIDTLLKTYLNRPAHALEYRRLHLFACVYAYIELLWYLARDEPTLNIEVLAQKQAALVQMLHR